MRVINKYFFALLITVCIIQFSGCFYLKTDSEDTGTFLPTLDETQTELFFGLSKPDGTSVSEYEWTKFVDDYISPKFIDGFTVVDAHGQWMDEDNKVLKENTKLVIIIYKRSQEMDTSIASVIDNYKKLFQQGSVLKVTSTVNIEE
jgi:hypothetical protein